MGETSLKLYFFKGIHMKAIQVAQAGGIEQLQLQECDIPQYGPDDVLVQAKVAGINFIDIYNRTGLYKPAYYPYIPGKEGSGVISAVGSQVKHLKPGDRVAYCEAGSGTYAEFVAIPAKEVVLIPESISFETAAAAMLQGLTAYYLSHITFPLHSHHIALIHAGAGGVGLLLIQMAKLLGAKIITTVSSDEKAKLAKSAGADNVIIYTRESFLEAVMSLTQASGVNVAYDSVGKTTFEDSMKSLAIRGMLVSYGQSSGPVATVDMLKLAGKSLFLTRPSLGHYLMTQTELNTMSSALFNLIQKNKIKITIGQRYPLADVAKAHADLEGRKTMGKSILVI